MRAAISPAAPCLTCTSMTRISCSSFFGRPVSVYSTGVTRGGDSIDHVVTQYNYARGPVVYAEGSWLLTGNFSTSYTVLCERATLDYDMARGAEALQVTEAGKKPRVVKPVGPGTRYIGEIRVHAGGDSEPQSAEGGDRAGWLERGGDCEAEAKSVRTGRVGVPVAIALGSPHVPRAVRCIREGWPWIPLRQGRCGCRLPGSIRRYCSVTLALHLRCTSVAYPLHVRYTCVVAGDFCQACLRCTGRHKFRLCRI